MLVFRDCASARSHTCPKLSPSIARQFGFMLFKVILKFISYYMFYSLHVVEPLRYDSVLIKETNE